MFPHARGILRRPAFTLVELLVVIAIIGVLIALLLPAVQQARESARASECKNNLKQIALAIHNFHDVRRVLPPANLKPRPGEPAPFDCGGKEPSWLAHVLPYLEQQNAAEGWIFSEEFASHPVNVRHQIVSTFICPSRRSPESAFAPSQTTTFKLPCGCGGTVSIVGGATVDYGGNMGDPSPGVSGASTDFYWGGNGTGVIIASRPRCAGGKPVDWVDRLSLASVTDGTSQTFLVGETHVPRGKLNVSPFNGPAYDGNHFAGFSRVAGPGFGLTKPSVDDEASSFTFGAWHPATCHFGLADGSVRGVSFTVATSVLGRLAHRGDGNPVTEY